MSSHDFPNYMYYCPLYEIDYKTIYHKLSVVACVSLLCEFYTLFFEDEVLVRNAAEPNEFISRFSIWSFEKSKARDNKQIVPIFVDEFEKYFPNKKYISHEFLANRKLEASVPYAEEVSLNPNENIYSLYELLFHYPGWRQKIDILE